MTKKSTASDFDPAKFDAALKVIKASPKPKKPSASDSIRQSAADLRALVADGWSYAEIAKAFTDQGVKMSAATLQKALAKRRRKQPTEPKATTPATTETPATYAQTDKVAEHPNQQRRITP